MTFNERHQDLGARAAIPFGVVLAAYGLLLKAQSWWGLGTTLVIGLGIGSVMAGFHTLRGLPSDRARPPIWLVGLVSIIPMALCAVLAYMFGPRVDRVALHDRDVADVTIALPEGDEAPRPRAGRVMIERIGGFDVAVAVLSQFGVLNDDSARAISESAAAQVNVKPEPVPNDDFAVGAGIPNRSFRIEASAGTLWMTMFTCGARIYAVSAGGHGALGLQRRMIASVRCRASASANAVPALVDLPADWHREESTPQRVRYVKGLDMLAVTEMDIIADDLLQKVAEGATRSIGVDVQLGVRQMVPAPDGARTVWNGVATANGDSIPFTIAIGPCHQHAVALVATVVAKLDEASRMDLLGHVRCAPNDRMTAPHH